MGKRYYCDYCDRHFVDNIDARKKHLYGVMHVKLRKEYYDQFKDAETRYKEEMSKSACKRFQRFGHCVFGSNCRYSHYTREQLEYLRQEAEEEKMCKPRKIDPSKKPTLASWLEKRHQRLLASSKTNVNVTLWESPSSFQNRTDLPPSLRPLRIEDFTHSDFDNWG